MIYDTFFQREEKLTATVSSFFFKRPDQFSFFPGQYLTLHIPNAAFPYDFTIASSPLDTDSLMLTTRNTGTEYKELLFGLLKGTPVAISGPLGGFYLRENTDKPKVLLSGGLGITPFVSMIRHFAEKKLSFPIILIANFPTREDSLFYTELKKLEQTTANLTVLYSLTRERNEWDGLTGRINENMLRKTIQDIVTPEYYICGSPSFGESTEQLLLSLGIVENSIKVELF